MTAADAAFANQPGLLRQQITTDPVASGAQPGLYGGADAAPDQVDRTVDYTGGKTLPAGTAWRWSGLFTAPSNPGGAGWQLKVFVASQAGSQLFVDSLANNPGRKANIGAYPAAPTSSYAGLTETSRSHDPANETLQQATYSVTLNPGQQSTSTCASTRASRRRTRNCAGCRRTTRRGRSTRRSPRPARRRR